MRLIILSPPPRSQNAVPFDGSFVYCDEDVCSNFHISSPAAASDDLTRLITDLSAPMEAFIYPPAAAEGKLSSDLSTPSTTKLWYKEKVYPIFSSFAGKVVGRYVCETLVLSSHFWEGKISVVSGREKSHVVTNSSRMKTIDSSHTHTHTHKETGQEAFIGVAQTTGPKDLRGRIGYAYRALYS